MEWFDRFGIILIILMGLVMAGMFHNDETKCKLKNPSGKPYTEESLFSETANGCKIYDVTKFSGTCDNMGHVYLTSCPSTVTWKDGKSPETSNTTIIK
jgi:hypothetical protein